jgi:MFS family permease
LNGIVFGLLLIFLSVNQQKTSFVTFVRSIDLIGVLMLIGGTIMLLLGLQFGGITYPWDSPHVICLIIFGSLLMSAFVFTEWRVGKDQIKIPIIPVHIFKHRSTLAVLVCFFIHGIIGVAPYYYLPLFFQTVRSATPTLSGVYILPMVLASSFASIFTGIFTKVTGRVVEPMLLGFALSTLGLGLFINLNELSSWAKLIVYQLIYGIGLGPNYIAPILAVQRVVRPKEIAIATSTLGFSRQLGSSVSLVVGGIIFQSQMQKHIPVLMAALGPEAAQRFAGSNAEASGGFIASLNGPEKQMVQKIYASSLQPMYYFYVAISGLSLIMSFLVGKLRTLGRLECVFAITNRNA